MSSRRRRSPCCHHSLASLLGDRGGLLLIGRRDLRTNNSWLHNQPRPRRGTQPHRPGAAPGAPGRAEHATLMSSRHSDNRGHCERLGLDADLTRLVHGVFLMGGEPFNTLIPPMLARLDRCKPRDIRAFVSLFDTLFPEDGDGAIGEEAGRHDPVLQRHIAYTDLWSATPPRSELQAVVDNSIGTTQVSLSFAEIADAWPVAALDPFHGQAATTDAPMLMLHGGLDPTMPLEEADRVFQQFSGPNQTAVPVPHAFHVAFNAGDCPVDMTLAFFADPLLPVDDACVADMEPTDFSGFGDFHEDVWGTDDRWGDQGCGGCNSTGSSGPGWAPGVLLLLLRRRRAAATSGSPAEPARSPPA